MPATSSRVRYAAHDLRNIPDAAMLTLLRDPIVVEAILDNDAVLAMPVFEYLWQMCRDDSSRCIELVGRHLSADQRALVLPGEERSRVLRSLLNHNVLTHAELSKVDRVVLSTEDGFIALDYYERDAVALAYLLRCVDESVRLCAMLRAAPDRFSDTAVLDQINSYYTLSRGAYYYDNYANTRGVLALRDLLELRPHLATKLIGNPDPRICLALADSRHVSNPEVLSFILGTPLERFDKDASFRVDTDVLYALSRNFYVPFAVRTLVIDRVATSGSELDELTAMSFTLPPDIASITDSRHLRMLTKRALKETGLYTSLRYHDWEVLPLAENPYLTRNDAYRIASYLAEPSRRLEYITRVGPDVAHRTFVAVNARCQSLEVPDSYKPVPRYYVEPPDTVFPPVNLDEPVTTQFAGTSVVAKDAALLQEYLGEAPSTWVSFIHSIDRVPDGITVRELVNTTLRITK